MFKKSIAKISMAFLGLALLAAPQASYADWGIGINIGGPGYFHDRPHGFYGWHDHPQWGWHIHVLPHGYFTVRVGGARYFYYDGLYYSYVGNGDYVLVNPPIGAFVNVIPPDFQPVIINGRTYYTNNGVYYILTRHHGYKVVVAPVVYAQPAQVVYAQNTFPVNIPNNGGGFTTVIIKKSGNGFVGPQGEFYPQFLSVSQLRAMYGR
jgi:hypothetical protein